MEMGSIVIKRMVFKEDKVGLVISSRHEGQYGAIVRVLWNNGVASWEYEIKLEEVVNEDRCFSKAI